MYTSYTTQQPTAQRRRRSDRYQEPEQGQALQQVQQQEPPSFQQQGYGGQDVPQPGAYQQPMAQEFPQQMGYQQAQQPVDYGQPMYYDPSGMAYQQPQQQPYQQQADYGWSQPAQQPMQYQQQNNQPYAPQQPYQQPQQGYGWGKTQAGFGSPYQQEIPNQPYRSGSSYDVITDTGYPQTAPYQTNAYPTMQSGPFNPFNNNPGDAETRHRGRFQLKWLLWLLTPVVVALVIMLVRVGRETSERRYEEAQIANYVTSYDNLFCEGVYVDGIHLGGMTQEEGINAVTTKAQQRNSDWYVRLTYNGQVVAQIDATQLGMKVEVMDVLRQAWQLGHTGSNVYERREAMQNLLENPVELYTAMPSGDTSVVDSILAKLSASAYKAPQDAQLIGFDPARADPFTIQEPVPGRVLNTTALKERIYQMVSTMESGELEIVPEEISPNVTVADLRKQVTLLADCTTDVSTMSVANRNANIARGCELLSGAVVQPGEVFSFNGRVGKRSIENGFFEAEEYVYGNTATGVGGGICQVSTTLYIAAVAANMKITDHTPHSMKANYTEYGMDATVYMDGKQIDFCFKNTSAYPIYIVASMPNKPKRSKEWMCEVKIYGMAFEEGVSYRLISEELELIPLPDPEYRTDRKGEYVTYEDEEYVYSAGREGHVTQSYSVKYLNGEEVARTALYKDTYKAATPIIYRGTQRRY